jgi:hypothetical protein
MSLQQLLRTPSVGLGSVATVVRAAVAGSLSYAIAASVGPERYAALAPVVAVFTVQGSVLGTLAQGVQRVAGTVLGVALAAVWVQLVGVSWWSILVALLASLAVARQLPLGFAGQAQIPISVLLTMALGPLSPGYGPWRVLDALIGGVVGIAVGVLVPERPAFGAAAAAQHRWADAVADQLDAIAAELDEPPTDLGDSERHGFIASSRGLVDVALAGRRATEHAQEGALFNPWGRHHRDQLAFLLQRERELTRLTIEVRVLSLTIDQLYDRSRLAPRLSRPALAALLRQLATLSRERRAGRPVDALDRGLRAQIARDVAVVTRDESDAYAVLDSVSVLGRLEQLRLEVLGADPAGALQPRDAADDQLSGDVEEGR